MKENKNWNQHSQIIIIGAGISAITFANLLVKKGFKPTLLEKSNGVGGRIATRRFKKGKWDHGIPWINESILPAWIVDDWKKVLVPIHTPHSRNLIAEDGLTQLPKVLSSSLNILRNRKVTNLKLTEEKPNWIVEDESGESLRADCVVLTIPAPQAIELLQKSNILESSNVSEALQSISYRPQVVILAEGQTGHIFDSEPDFKTPVELMVDNGRKGINGSNDLVTIYFDEAFSFKNFDKQDDWIINFAKDFLLKEYGMVFSHLEIKRWRYSQTVHCLKVPFLQTELSSPLFLIGDSFCGGGLRGSLLSAWNLAQTFN